MVANKKRGGKKKKHLKGAAFKRSAQYRKMRAGLAKWKRAHGKASGSKKGRRAAPKRRKAARATGAAKYRRATVRLGRKTVKTYLYRTKTGTLKHLPRHAVIGFKSQKAMAAAGRKHPKTLGRIVAREQAIQRARERAAARVLKHGDVFTPNARGTRVIPYEEWSSNMTPNKKRGKGKKKGGRKAKRTRKQIAAAMRNLRKARAAAKRKRKGGGAKRRKSTGRRVAAKRRTHRKGGARRTTSRRKGGKRKGGKAASRRRASYRKHVTALRRLGRYMRNEGAAPMAAKPNRRGRKKHYRRNSDFVEQIKRVLTTGAVVTVGFASHRALTKVLNEQVLAKVDALSTGKVGEYRQLISSALVTAVGIPVAAKFAGKHAAAVGAGIGTSFLLQVLTTVLTKMGKPDIAGYLSGYGEYIYPQSPLPISGYGAYELQQAAAGYGVDPTLARIHAARVGASGYGAMLTQAAAGYGADPRITQAAAGYGAELTQAAAGVGEYMLTGASGIGEYFETGVSGMGAYYTDDGIRPNLAAAEYALTKAEAAAGVGEYFETGVSGLGAWDPDNMGDPAMLSAARYERLDLPQTSTVEPMDPTVGGSEDMIGAGILAGGEGIFG